ncbi:MAG: serine/threonine protein kinase, partial [Myxococcales bacterium]|nr:serine/threonine protein kinase [Myxococcales bacterium]
MDEIDALLRQVAHAPPAGAGSVPAVAFGSDGVTVRDEPEMPERLGRFALRRTLGAGGMGIIYEAHDPTLDRSVAIKCLRAEGAEPAARLLREAQALGRLAHPNVVTIFEVGQDGDRVYLAMELVHGTTARAWRAAAPRTEREILDVWHQASAGLAAAHAAGLVHRDVKPENVLVGDDGRVRIGDLGLAAAYAAPSAEPEARAPADPLATPLTQTGTLLGTPPYMSPEALEGGAVDARGDQWSLCVSLWEALSGERPFTGATQAELAAAIRARPITRGRDAIAPALRAVLERGLSVEPAARWPSIAALVTALDAAATTPPRSRRTRRRVWIGAGAGGVVALAATWVALDRDRPSPPAAHEGFAPPAAAAVRLTEPGACPYMPIYGDDHTVVFDDGNGDLWKLPRGGTATPLVSGPTNDWRPSRGQHSGEIIFARTGGKPGKRGGRTTLDGRALDDVAIDSASFAYAREVLFYARTDLGEVRRVR